MIISASRRTDIPAFYAKWFINRIRSGFCTVPNPFNSKQETKVSLLTGDVDFIVFWTRFPRPLFQYLNELDQNGYNYYFHFSLLNYPTKIENNTPNLQNALNCFKELSDKIGANKIIWRYDPILFNKQLNVKFHIDTFRHISESLRGYTIRSVISLVDVYRKVTKRLEVLNKTGYGFSDHTQLPVSDFEELMLGLCGIAHDNKMEIVSCAEDPGLEQYGIKPGKCIDNEYIKVQFGIDVTNKSDKSQRGACGCVASKDIGMYNTCQFGCQYCYATSSFEKSKINYLNHDHNSPSMV